MRLAAMTEPDIAILLHKLLKERLHQLPNHIKIISPIGLTQ